MEFVMKNSIVKLSSVFVATLISGILCLSSSAFAGDNAVAVEKKKLTDDVSTAEVKSSVATTKLKTADNNGEAIKVEKKAVKLKKAKHHAKIKVNINTATELELLALKGIGKKKAKAIVRYREANGRFNKASDLLNVKGIGKKLLKKNKDRVIISGKSILPPVKKLKKKKERQVKSDLKAAVIKS